MDQEVLCFYVASLAENKKVHLICVVLKISYQMQCHHHRSIKDFTANFSEASWITKIY